MAFYFAIARGMLFFIAWSEPRHWSVGLSDAGFAWDWDEAVRRGDMCGADTFDAVAPRTKAVLVHGGIYQAVEHRMPPPLPGFKGALVGYEGNPLIRPSLAVRRNLQSRFIDALRGSFVVGMAIRMGGDAQGFGNDPGIPEFLSAGDEMRFVLCARKLAAERAPPQMIVRYVLVSDSHVVVSAVKAELGDALVERSLPALALALTLLSISRRFVTSTQLHRSSCVAYRLFLLF
jgi:hypothetical protein